MPFSGGEFSRLRGSDMTFERPALLVLLVLAPLYYGFRIRWLNIEEKRLRLFVRPVLWERVHISAPPVRVFSRLLWTFSIALLAVSAAGPRWGSGEGFIPMSGENVVIALDVSASMWSSDEVPSRMSRASSEILRLMDELPGVRFSLVLFSGQARLAVPITLDAEFLESRLPMMIGETTSLPPGTRLGSLIEVMSDALPDMDLESRIGIIFSDGGFHDYSVESAVDQARREELSLVTVGVGGVTPVPVPDGHGGYIIDEAGDTVRTVLEEDALEFLAEETGGFYLRMAEVDNLPQLIGSMLEHSTQQARDILTGGSIGRRYQYFLSSALLLMCVAIVLERKGL
jgi:Ca-activated chloride channel family protein